MVRNMLSYLRIVGFGGLFCAIKAKATNSTILFSVSRQDIKFPFRLRIISSDVLVYNQVFLEQEYDFFVSSPPKTIVDAGANIGLTSIYFANKYPRANIIAIEPEVNNFRLLKENVAQYKNITTIHAALWNKNEEINLFDPGLGKWAFMTAGKDSSEDSLGDFCHTVNAITIDKIIEDYELHKIDILKIDIEGAEREVFHDTSSWIEKVDAIIIELHERLKSGCIHSFYNGSNGFSNEWEKGENVFLSRGKCLKKQ